MRAVLHGVLALLLWMAMAAAQAVAPPLRFVSVAFHDVVDDARELNDDAVTTDRLVAFFDWLQGNGWHPIGLEDLAAAKAGTRPLPDKAILLTFDDGYRSLFTRVYPLLLAYRFPAVAALVGAWMDAPLTSTVRYGDHDVPRHRFITWDEARQMQASGWVEFASHSYDLHQGVLANPQGNRLPATAARQLTPTQGYETDAAFRARMAANLAQSRALMQRELGRAPRALVWPFGRYTGPAIQAAHASGFDFAFTLDPEPGDASQPLQIDRFHPTGNPSVANIVANLRFDTPYAPSQRLVCVNPAALWHADPAQADAQLGTAIERLRQLGATTVVLEATVSSAAGTLSAAWFPTTALPLQADLLNRLAWQLHTRAGVAVFLRLPHRAALATLGDEAKVLQLYRDLGAHVPAEGLLVEDTAFPHALPDDAPPPSQQWTLRAARLRLPLTTLPPADRLAWQAFREVAFQRPGLRFVWVAPPNSVWPPQSQPHLADVLLLPAATRPTHHALPLRAGLWWTGTAPPAAATLAPLATAFLRQGGRSLGWCPDDTLGNQPNAAALAPTVSAATFPVRF